MHDPKYTYKPYERLDRIKKNKEKNNNSLNVIITDAKKSNDTEGAINCYFSTDIYGMKKIYKDGKISCNAPDGRIFFTLNNPSKNDPTQYTLKFKFRPETLIFYKNGKPVIYVATEEGIPVQYACDCSPSVTELTYKMIENGELPKNSESVKALGLQYEEAFSTPISNRDADKKIYRVDTIIKGAKEPDCSKILYFSTNNIETVKKILKYGQISYNLKYNKTSYNAPDGTIFFTDKNPSENDLTRYTIGFPFPKCTIFSYNDYGNLVAYVETGEGIPMQYASYLSPSVKELTYKMIEDEELSKNSASFKALGLKYEESPSASVSNIFSKVVKNDNLKPPQGMPPSNNNNLAIYSIYDSSFFPPYKSDSKINSQHSNIIILNQPKPTFADTIKNHPIKNHPVKGNSSMQKF